MKYIFDLYGVVFLEETPPTLFDLFKEKFGMNQAQIDFIQHELIPKIDKGILEIDDYYEQIAVRLNKPELFGQIRDVQRAFENSTFVIQSTVDLIKKLYLQDESVYYFTNLSKDNFQERRKHEVFQYFTGGVTSFETGSAKPDMQIYRILLAKYSLDPKKCVFIDDKAANLRPAETLGMHTVNFRQGMDLKKELSKLL